MAAQGLKELAQTKVPKFGHFIVEFATPGIGHILKSAGCDFVLFDLEHSGFGFETVKSAIRYFEAADTWGSGLLAGFSARWASATSAPSCFVSRGRSTCASSPTIPMLMRRS